MKQIITTAAIILAATLNFTFANAEETTGEKINHSTNQAVDSVKETARDIKDKGCEMVNGKLHCIGKKIKNKAATLKDKAKTEAKHAEDKVD